MRPHSNLFPHHPLVHLAIALSAGICTSHYVSLKFSLAAGAVFTAITLTLLIKHRLLFAGLTLLSAIFFAGATLTKLEGRADSSSPLRLLLEQSDGAPITLTGWLDGPPEFARDRVYLSLRVENVRGRVSLLVTLRDTTEFTSLNLRYGTRISLTTTF